MWCGVMRWIVIRHRFCVITTSLNFDPPTHVGNRRRHRCRQPSGARAQGRGLGLERGEAHGAEELRLVVVPARIPAPALLGRCRLLRLLPLLGPATPRDAHQLVALYLWLGRVVMRVGWWGVCNLSGMCCTSRKSESRQKAE